jgi:hypothetical protein
MNPLHPARHPHEPAVGAPRRGLQHRLAALRAGLRAALRALRGPSAHRFR